MKVQVRSMPKHTNKVLVLDGPSITNQLVTRYANIDQHTKYSIFTAGLSKPLRSFLLLHSNYVTYDQSFTSPWKQEHGPHDLTALDGGTKPPPVFRMEAPISPIPRVAPYGSTCTRPYLRYHKDPICTLLLVFILLSIPPPSPT